jgi:D-amino-acid oxidase
MAGRVTVVGAGIVGLSCAVRLAESGTEVNVVARDLPLETTSAVAGGLWLPWTARRRNDPGRWARETLEELLRLASQARGDAPDTTEGSVEHGVRVMPGTLLPAPMVDHSSTWDDDLATLIEVSRARDPAPGFDTGLRMRIPLVHLPRYLTYLTARLMAAGGTLTRMALPSLPERGIVVNCTGVAARALVPDPSVRPVRSQVVIVANPGLDEWLWYDEEPGDVLCVLPRGTEVTVGCTLEDGDWSLRPDHESARRLVSRARRLVPALENAPTLAHRVGLRPVRPAVRLDIERHPTEEDPSHLRLHCYGHGGSGVTLAWGCAGDVVRLVHGLVIQPTLPL